MKKKSTQPKIVLFRWFFGRFCLVLLWISIEIGATEIRPQTMAQEADQYIAVLFEGNNEHNTLFLESFEQQFYARTQGLRPIYINLAPLNDIELKAKLTQDVSCILTIGSIVTPKVLATRPQQPIYAVQVPRYQLDHYRKIYQPLGINVSGLYEEQSVSRQIELAKAINPKLTDATILYDQDDRYYIAAHHKILEQAAIEFRYQILQQTDSPDKYLTYQMKPNGYLLKLNNSRLYKHSHMASTVLAASHKNVNIIGNTIDDTLQGALASVYTPATSLALEALSNLKSLCKGNNDLEPHYAHSFNISINQHIAKASNHPNLSSSLLYREINRVESQSKEQLINE